MLGASLVGIPFLAKVEGIGRIVVVGAGNVEEVGDGITIQYGSSMDGHPIGGILVGLSIVDQRVLGNVLQHAVENDIGEICAQYVAAVGGACGTDRACAYVGIGTLKGVVEIPTVKLHLSVGTRGRWRLEY